jgi:RloB-like protein
LITSFPCYEFWLYLHFKQDRSPIGPGIVGGKSPSDRLLSKMKQIPELKNYSKSDSLGLFDYLQPQLKTAITHAAWVLKQAESEDNPDPSTSIHLLLKVFEKLAKPQPVSA